MINFIDQQTAPTDEPEVDWNKERQEWQQTYASSTS